MPVLSRCPLCRGIMPESRAEARCPRCGELVLAVQRKLCASCGQDVSRQKRVRDEAGEYYCHGCWESRLAARGEEVGYICGACRKVFGSGEVYQDGEGAICFSCHADRELDPNALLAAAAAADDSGSAIFYPSVSVKVKPQGTPWGLIAAGIALLLAIVGTLVMLSMR